MYMVLGHGPDRDQDITGDPAIYDPFNGKVSTGDLIYFGPSVGFDPL